MDDAVIDTFPLGFPWRTIDPFLFCVHHLDHYPAGNEAQGPAASLSGRSLGQDFTIQDGWRMYHGRTVPGFPSHPHRGFETITIARKGFIDHSDSLGATARFGQGDVQWMTAGKGVVHAEMFPLRDREGPNTGELFQIWINLPAAKKMVDPYFTMLWHEEVPELTTTDATGRTARVRVIAGDLLGATPPAPPPDSWASDPRGDVAILTLDLDAGTVWTLPQARPGTRRVLYLFEGDDVMVGDQTLRPPLGVEVRADQPVRIHAGGQRAELLMLQGRPIAEPVAHHGPFVMNTRAELQQAYDDYRRTRFGGWPWPQDDPVHPREEGRFARHADGRVETREA